MEIAPIWMPVLMGLVIVFMLLLHLTLFRPIAGILEERRRRVAEGEARDRASRETTEARLAAYRDRLAAARKEAFALIENARTEAGARKDASLLRARSEATGEVTAAAARIEEGLAAARADLRREARGVADAIVASILRRPAGGRA